MANIYTTTGCSAGEDEVTEQRAIFWTLPRYETESHPRVKTEDLQRKSLRNQKAKVMELPKKDTIKERNLLPNYI